jgi:hypothetical protein
MNYSFYTLLCCALLGFVSVDAQSDKSFYLQLTNDYSSSFVTETQDVPFKGRYGFRLQGDFHFNSSDSIHHASLGLALSKVGHSSQFFWEDSSPELELLYGKFPIKYKMSDDVYFFSINYGNHFGLGQNYNLRAYLSLDYPIGTAFFRERSSADEKVVEMDRNRFDQTKYYIWNSSLGFAVQIDKRIRASAKYPIILGFNFKIYTLLAFRDNDYFPHEPFERPYSIGFSVATEL